MNIKMRRHAKGRRKRPYRQGDLDALCGLYSVVNAAHVLCPELDQDSAAWLFDGLIQALPRGGADPSWVVTGGVRRSAVIKLLRVAAAYIDDEFNIKLSVRRLSCSSQANVGLGELWQTLRKTLSPSCVAVLGVAGRQSHWTVAVKITESRIELCDSSRMKILRRRNCTTRRLPTRYGLNGGHVILLRRKSSAN